MRVLLFTDTLADVNGVSRFIRSSADQALATGRDLRVVTSTRFAVPPGENLVNLPPRLAMRMPKYEHLELALPPLRAVLRFARAQRPDVIHVSTPGPVGCAGRIAAGRLGVPLVGVYHTDFPAYIERLFLNESLTYFSEKFMRGFYAPFAAVFTRSREYAQSLVRFGLRADRVVALRPGIRLDQFDPERRDERVARAAGLAPAAVRVLYVGRVSVEKNLPMLADAWVRADRRLLAMGLAAELVIVGDGPYRGAMERALRGTRNRFLGFRYADELASLYASCDLFVFPSATDTLGQVVMEAQASGLPVIVSDRGGPREVVQNGRTGLVIEGGSVSAWSDAITTLARDGALRRRMGPAACEFMRGFSFARSFEHFWSVHERVREEAKVPHRRRVIGS